MITYTGFKDENGDCFAISNEPIFLVRGDTVHANGKQYVVLGKHFDFERMILYVMCEFESID